MLRASIDFTVHMRLFSKKKKYFYSFKTCHFESWAVIRADKKIRAKRRRGRMLPLFWLVFPSWLRFMLVFHPYFGLCFLCPLFAVVVVPCLLLSERHVFIWVWGCKLGKTAGSSCCDIIQFVCQFVWLIHSVVTQIKTKNSTASPRTTCLVAGHTQSKRHQTSPRGVRPCDTAGNIFLLINISLLQTWYIFHWCICICCSVFLLVVSDWSLTTSLVH